MGGHKGEMHEGTSGALANTNAGNAQQTVKQLVDELKASGIKCTEENIVGICRTDNGRIVWLEKGRPGDHGSGLAHIIERHGPQFAQHGISEKEIPSFVMKAVAEGKIVGYQGSGTGRPIFEVAHNGKTHQVAITIGDNGYIVGANHRGIAKE